LKTKLATLAGHILGVKPATVVFQGGRVGPKGAKKSLAFAEAVGAAYTAKSLPPGMEPGMEATHFFEPSNFTFPFGAHVAAVEVDAETGEVKVEKYIAVDDCGNVINPLLVDGQIHGGIVQGIAQALYEEVIYDEQGQLVTGELMNYAVPRAIHAPEFVLDRTVTPSPVNPMGVKGVGEAGTIGSTPAVVNAVCDAVAPLGIRHIDMPLKPEKVWRAIREARASSGAKIEMAVAAPARGKAKAAGRRNA
jgi:carbon-monoxide dehydrogenase large subunit